MYYGGKRSPGYIKLSSFGYFDEFHIVVRLLGYLGWI